MEERFDGALEGRPSGTSETDELPGFVADVRAAFPPEPLLAQEAHLETILHAARRIPAFGRPSGERKEQRVRIPRFRSLTAKVAAAFVLVTSSLGGLAVAGALPGGLQDDVADVVATMGVDLPGGDDEAVEVSEADEVEDESPEPDGTEASEAEDEAEDDATEAESDDQGEDSDDQGEDSDDQGEDSDDQGED